jgi:hypothetical protein
VLSFRARVFILHSSKTQTSAARSSDDGAVVELATRNKVKFHWIRGFRLAARSGRH